MFNIHVHGGHNSESFQVHNSANANQKEKYEGDLKKEIKKLQVRTTKESFFLTLLTGFAQA